MNKKALKEYVATQHELCIAYNRFLANEMEIKRNEFHVRVNIMITIAKVKKFTAVLSKKISSYFFNASREQRALFWLNFNKEFRELSIQWYKANAEAQAILSKMCTGQE